MSKSIVVYVSKNKQENSNNLWKDIEKMDKHLRIHTDELIRQYKKVSSSGYEFNLDSLPDSEKASFIDALYLNDPATTEFLNNKMAELCEERIGWVEAEDMVEKGLSPIKDRTNGEIIWIRR